MPVKSTIASRDHRWVYLGAMDQMIALIAPNEHLAVRDTEVVLDLMHQAGLSRDYSSEKVHQLFNVTGAALVVAGNVLVLSPF